MISGLHLTWPISICRPYYTHRRYHCISHGYIEILKYIIQLFNELILFTTRQHKQFVYCWSKRLWCHYCWPSWVEAWAWVPGAPRWWELPGAGRQWACWDQLAELPDFLSIQTSTEEQEKEHKYSRYAPDIDALTPLGARGDPRSSWGRARARARDAMIARAMKTFILYEFFQVRKCPRSWEALLGMILLLDGFCLYTWWYFLFANGCIKRKCKCRYRYCLNFKYAHLPSFRFVNHLIYMHLPATSSCNWGCLRAVSGIGVIKSAPSEASIAKGLVA